jgi:shikimate dehydrogenase
LGGLAGVLGFPVAHSRSPAMMGAAFRELGLEWRYLKLPVPPPLLAATARALPRSGYVGANVTVPHKVAAHDLADELTAAAAAIGAANTLSFRDGRIEADNTDADGFLDALGEPPRGRSALVLGAGGAARAVVWALRQAGAAEVFVWNRTPQRAAALAAAFAARRVERPAAVARELDLLVNATSVGLEPGTTEDALLAALELHGVEPPALVVDLVYGSGTVALRAWAEHGGATVVNGLEVLVRQGARSLRRWTGREAPLEVMRRAVGGAAPPGDVRLRAT